MNICDWYGWQRFRLREKDLCLSGLFSFGFSMCCVGQIDVYELPMPMTGVVFRVGTDSPRVPLDELNRISYSVLTTPIKLYPSTGVKTSVTSKTCSTRALPRQHVLSRASQRVGARLAGDTDSARVSRSFSFYCVYTANDACVTRARVDPRMIPRVT